MAIEYGLGRFGDRRLEKGGSTFMRPLLSGPVPVSGGLRDDERRKCGSRGFCAITL
jgi:hypothetical protein